MVQFVFTTAEDNRVCPICSSLNGLVFEVDDPSMTEIPVHGNCRCRYILFNESDKSLLPFLPLALLPVVLKICPEGYHWDDGELGCVPDDETT